MFETAKSWIRWLQYRRRRPVEAARALFPDMPPLDRDGFMTVRRAQRFSMMHTDTLKALWHLARHGEGTIVEIGPYIGSATVVMARALRGVGRRRPFLTVEVGGDNSALSALPSADIVRDLEANLRRFGVRDLVRILVGWSHDAGVVSAIHDVAAAEPIGLLVVDANGDVEGEWQRFGRYCRPDCVVVFDDFLDLPDNLVKAAHVQAGVSRLLARNELKPVGILPHSTWFGRVAA
jgi:predicted O-methyltransferase YrrM